MQPTVTGSRGFCWKWRRWQAKHDHNINDRTTCTVEVKNPLSEPLISAPLPPILNFQPHWPTLPSSLTPLSTPESHTGKVGSPLALSQNRENVDPDHPTHSSLITTPDPRELTPPRAVDAGYDCMKNSLETISRQMAATYHRFSVDTL